MCGICGWLGDGPSEPTTAAQLFDVQSRLLQHRGPDDQGLEHGPGWGLGFRRLSIVDLSHAGHQPMSIDSGRFRLAFNGEIYNHVELRADLEARGVVLRGSSDTEVLLHLLAQRGVAALDDLNGMFALAFVDTAQRRFILARDRMGKKPLYLHRRSGHLRFGSELKALMAWPDASRELNLDAVAEFLQQGYVTGSHTILAKHERLRPGHYLAGDLDHPERAVPHPYWSVDLATEPASDPSAAVDGDALDELHALLADAVRIRLRSDVPVGTFLSGGIDSGLVTSLMAEQGAHDALALTVGFDEADHDETEMASSVAHHTGLRHQVVQVDRSGLDGLDRISWFYDEPFADASALPTMALCAAASDHATVFLTGDGGDESFAGYRSYIEAKRRAWLTGVAEPVRSAATVLARLLPVMSSSRYQLTKAALPSDGFAAAFDGIPNDPMLSEMTQPRMRPHLERAATMLFDDWSRSQGRDLTARQQLLDYNRYLPDDILVKMDRASMASSIEVRSPLLDHRIVEWASRVPRSALIEGDIGKMPLRALASRLLPARVGSAPKMGFGVPLDAWFREPKGQTFVLDRLLGSNAADRGVWSSATVERMLAEHLVGNGRSFGTFFWRLLVLDGWARVYLDPAEIAQQPPEPVSVG